MTQHLSPREFVDALDGTLATDRLDHLEACDVCRREVPDLGALVADARGAREVPEPSPLFWDHFSRRVSAATSADAVPARGWWHAGVWRPLLALGALAGAVALVVSVLPRTPAESSGAPPAAVLADQSADASSEVGIDEDALNLVTLMASDLSFEELQQEARPTAGATAAVIDQLTPAQRAEFIRLIKIGMGDPE
jgi:hypothetical protein